MIKQGVGAFNFIFIFTFFLSHLYLLVMLGSGCLKFEVIMIRTTNKIGYIGYYYLWMDVVLFL